MKCSVAQLKAIKGDISQNIIKHKELIQLAVSEHSDLIVFPELSITGYEPTYAALLATHKDDDRFVEFQDISNRHEIIICLGCPIRIERDVYIGMIIFQPFSDRQIYTKQFLHQDELPYFSQGNNAHYICRHSHTIAPAICYESLRIEHVDKAFEDGADIYMVSVAKHQIGINQARRHYANVAQRYAMTVIMSNSVGYCDNFESAGCSSIWNSEGKLMGELNNHSEGILTYDTQTQFTKAQDLSF